MPLPTKTVLLEEPIVGHGEPIREVVLSQPTLVDFFEIGSPMLSMNVTEETSTWVENDAAVNRYLQRCLVSPQIDLLMGQATLVDAMNIKEALLDFFVKAIVARASPSSRISPSSS